MCLLFEARMLVALCIVELSNDGSHILTKYDAIQEVDACHHEGFFSS